MNLETRIAIKNNPYYYNFLRDNSYWYKALNRDPDSIKLMDQAVKDYYKLNTSDKIEDLSKKINMISKLIDLLK